MLNHQWNEQKWFLHTMPKFVKKEKTIVHSFSTGKESVLRWFLSNPLPSSS
ncbi:hypothetical protein GTCCBUS3UF5_18370 [Geobacillus thermoleovorans CCB_US3_UF5]|uniref:Uncharacterized protein n=1 Tax=Geobacillus thermoleovorans CCB_US3_UF5 TaxID=1111068 RepID=A0ABM5MHP1_GEOTH|nr:hypothetical protein GTCCBUS3UF5_18370 [Geobacillus thermoleovorans CCB_US3_UF5]GAJ59047.1 hypothetical protein B23_2271 [Geobacillus thermoleovorans B23]